MSCQNCDGKKILKIMQGTKAREIYITVKGLDWDFMNPPSGYSYTLYVEYKREGLGGSILASAVNENTLKFTLNAYDTSDPFYDTGLYSLVVRLEKWTDPPGSEPEQEYRIPADTCIYIYDTVNCPPPC